MKLEEALITSSCGEYTRSVWFASSETKEPHPLCVFLDAEIYIHAVKAPPILKEMLQSGALPPMSFLFVSHGNPLGRHLDYTCNDGYARFLGEDLLPWARNKNSLIRETDHTICGLSLSGLAGANVACNYSIFSSSLCQSGSFWWLIDYDHALPSTQGKFWLSVGDQETTVNVVHPPTNLFQKTSQIEGVETMADKITSQGGTVKYQPYSGGHDPVCWREELALALQWLIGK